MTTITIHRSGSEVMLTDDERTAYDAVADTADIITALKMEASRLRARQAQASRYLDDARTAVTSGRTDDALVLIHAAERLLG